MLFSLVALASIFTPFMASTEILALRFLALALTIAHVHYAVCVVQQMCDHFKIEALSLTRKEDDSSRQRLLAESMNTNTLGLHRPNNESQDNVSRLSDQSSS